MLVIFRAPDMLVASLVVLESRFFARFFLDNGNHGIKVSVKAHGFGIKTSCAPNTLSIVFFKGRPRNGKYSPTLTPPVEKEGMRIPCPPSI
jgi:hypothetical protein